MSDDTSAEETPFTADGEAPESPNDPFGLGLDELLAEEFPEDSLEGQLAAAKQEAKDYLETAQRVQADFENYRRRVAAQQAQDQAKEALALVRELLPVLDACDAALGHGADDVAPIQGALMAALERKGFARIDADGADFDPELYEAVMQEPGEGGENGPVVAEVLRSGYQFNGQVVRPAMVKVRG